MTLAHGTHAVRLRPTLRAAWELERLHDGFAGLLRKVQEGDTATLHTVIQSAASDPNAADRFLRSTRNMPLADFLALTQAPALDLIAAIFPEPETTSDSPKPARRVTWAEIFDGLYKIATGWLEWPPEIAWTATPYEITAAYTAHLDKLKALHGAAEDEPENHHPSEEQRQRNIDAGLDPDLDLDRLQALKARLQGGA
ncbi:hypothetical protein [Pseudoponticoccus marisrubri]|uniref:hypothetical protein n=1 Tax=Pseudoponticoccus marisrubri TaxID=1685382 RepID=UPI0012FE061C|nr:hypothetical protein [Pseudoponticoccus marisrubri]